MNLSVITNGIVCCVYMRERKEDSYGMCMHTQGSFLLFSTRTTSHFLFYFFGSGLVLLI